MVRVDYNYMNFMLLQESKRFFVQLDNVDSI